MGTTGNKIINEKIHQLTKYYIFHKKLEKIINKGINPYCINKDIIDIYIINPNWINLWKIYTNYEKVKIEFDTIEDEDEISLLNKLENKCIYMVRNRIINDSNGKFPTSMDNTEFANQFFELQFIKNEVFDYLIDYETNKAFFNIYNPMNLLNNYTIKGKINNIMLILMMEQNYKIKFIYQAKIEEEIILTQLTAYFSLESKFNTFCNSIKNKSSNDILYFLSKTNIANLLQISINDEDNNFYYILKNDNLNIQNLFNKTLNKSITNINFSNIDKSIFIGLNNINNPPYLNSVIQNLINIDVLTKFLLNEYNFKLIIQMVYTFNFTRFYCELLSIMYCSNLKYYDLKDFNEIIYLMNSNFKFNINCIPGDLIKFILETLNFEFNKLFENKIKNNKQNNIYINNNIITSYFTCIKGTKIECLNCKNIKIIPINSFSLEFSLDIIFNSYGESKNLQKNTDGKYIISLENCFENYITPLFFNSDNDIICNICKKSANSKYINEFYFFPYILIIIVNKEINNNEYIFSFPENLNLESYITIISPKINKKDLNLKYQLRGIISHYNNSDKKKQYLAFCRHRIMNIWYKYDDLKINKCKNQIKDILNENVDVLIYESIKEYPNLTMKQNTNNNIMKKYSTEENNNNNIFIEIINRNTIGVNNNFSEYTHKMLKERLFPNLSSINNNIIDNNDINSCNNNNNNNNIYNKKNEEDKKKKLFESMKKHIKNNTQNTNEDAQINDIHLSILNSINSINNSKSNNINNYNSINDSDSYYNENKQIELKMDNI